MKRLNKNELVGVVGGWNLSGPIINAFVNAGKFLYDTGKNVGSSIRRISANKTCPIR